MGWNGKDTNIKVNPSIYWHDYFPEEKVDEFLTEIRKEIRELVETRLEEKFAEEKQQNLIQWMVM